MFKSLKPKTCKNVECCRLYVPRTMTQVVCSIPCARPYLEHKAREKARKDNKKAVKELRRESKAYQHKLTQKVFNRLRVLEEIKWFRDSGREPECISCGKMNMDWCAGHFKSVGGNGQLRYDPKNVYLQCNTRCNSHLSGNIHGNSTTRGYIQGLQDRFGEKEGLAIKDYCETTNDRATWGWQDLELMRAEFSEKVRKLEKELGIA